MREVLYRAEAELPDLLRADEWHSLRVNHRLPIVHRLWRTWGAYRIHLDRVYPCNTLVMPFLPVLCASATRLVDGSYELRVGMSDIVGSQPPAAKIVLTAPAAIEMINYHASYALSPLDTFGHLVTVTASPIRHLPKPSGYVPQPLSGVDSESVMKFFLQRFPTSAGIEEERNRLRYGHRD